MQPHSHQEKDACEGHPNMGSVFCILSQYLGKVLQMMAYVSTIIMIEKDLENEAWQNHEVAYRHQAAITKSHEWGSIEPTFYSIVVYSSSSNNQVCGCSHTSKDMSPKCHSTGHILVIY